jgi:hypothetical protein
MLAGARWKDYIPRMTKLDLVLERIRRLPQERQDMIALELQFMLDHGVGETSALTDEQWADIEADLANEDKEEIPHAQVVAEMRAKFGESGSSGVAECVQKSTPSCPTLPRTIPQPRRGPAIKSCT